jgi:DNA-binding XRE family transcriptional regulator
MKTQQVKDDLEQLLADNSDLAKAANERAGLAEIASLLLQTRHELDLSQKALAERAGLTKSMISEIENTANDGVTLRPLSIRADTKSPRRELRSRRQATT